MLSSGVILHLQQHLFRLYDGVPEGLLHLLRFGRFDGRVIPEKVRWETRSRRQSPLIESGGFSIH